MVKLAQPSAAWVLLGIAWATSACSDLLPFGKTPLAEPHPTPAALPDDESRLQAPEMPLALALDNDYVVRVIAGPVTCSGTLIADDQVLTAHHCVTKRNDFGEVLARDARPRDIRVELGGDYLPWGEVGVRAVVAPPCGFAAGEGDIAILVLERKLIGVPTVKTRLDAPPELGEKIEPVGFGRCALSTDGIRRKTRIGGSLSKLGASGFRVAAGICPGDSGGPALSRTSSGAAGRCSGALCAEIVGVISTSVMDGDEDTRGLSQFTRLDRWRSVFGAAKLIAEGVSRAELPPLDCAELVTSQPLPKGGAKTP